MIVRAGRLSVAHWLGELGKTDGFNTEGRMPRSSNPPIIGSSQSVRLTREAARTCRSTAPKAAVADVVGRTALTYDGAQAPCLEL